MGHRRMLVAEIRERLLTGLKPDCCNIGFNDGLAAGQTVAHCACTRHPPPEWRCYRSPWRNTLGDRG